MALAAISGTISTAVVGLVILACVIMAVRSIRKNKKRGGGCGCGCSGCSANCHGNMPEDIKDLK